MSHEHQENDLNAARAVLTMEAEALQKMAHFLDASLSAAIDLLLETRGKVVVSGMGKSGHISAKIAATLASTGTPAFAVHPGEASHGDLGMITPEDALIVLSNSGETAELRDLVAYARIRGNRLIAIVGKAGSSLGNAADVAFVLPQVGEACPLGLAPTTSSTMMLALGDALAVALMKRRGFTADEFHKFHPGGKLGQRFVGVADIMHKDQALPLVSPDTSMADAILEMSDKGLGCVGVTDDSGDLVGIITDGDLRRAMAPDLLAKKAGEVMTENPLTISPHMLASEALSIMEKNKQKKITNLFVLQDGKPVGVIHIHDILSAGIA